MPATITEQHQAHDHEMPTSGGPLTRLALSATLHCLTGCAIGEVLGMVIGTALGFSELGTVALAVTLAFLFGYGLTSLPLLRAGMALSAVIPIALAADTLSIATMEIVDNAIMLGVPGAMEAGVGSVLFWASLSVALVVAGAVALPLNRWLIARGKGHAVIHETGIHGGPSPRAVAIVAIAAFIFGTAGLTAELVDGSPAHGAPAGGHERPAAGDRQPAAGHGQPAAGPEQPAAGHGQPAAGHGQPAAGHGQANAAAVRGLSATEGGLTLALDRARLPRAVPTTLRFRVVDRTGAAVRDFDVEHDRRMHLIVVRRDLTGFQHLHPRMSASGTWSVSLTLPAAGRHRVFADFERRERKRTLARDVLVEGASATVALPPPRPRGKAAGGYRVALVAAAPRARDESRISFAIAREDVPVVPEPYLGARGHLVALRASDLAYLHVHPDAAAGADRAEVRFATTFPSAGRYRLFLQFRHAGRVRTVAFTRVVARGDSAPAPGAPQAPRRRAAVSAASASR